MGKTQLTPVADYDLTSHSRCDQPASIAERLDGQALLVAIARKLLERVVAFDVAPGIDGMAIGVHPPRPAPPSAPLDAFLEEEAPALSDFDLSDQQGRFGFLWALFSHHYRHGLFLAVQHVWASLARPKAVRCQIMAQRLGLPGTGKTAIKNVLAAFLQETLYGVEFPSVPILNDYRDSVHWNAACVQHFADIDAKFDAIVARFEAILDGRELGSFEAGRT